MDIIKDEEKPSSLEGKLIKKDEAVQGFGKDVRSWYAKDELIITFDLPPKYKSKVNVIDSIYGFIKNEGD